MGREMHLTLERFKLMPKYTIGRLYVDGAFECYTLEDTVREGEKIPGQTAIPYGTYQVLINRSIRFKRDLPLLVAVPNFSGIRIHSGNTEHDTEGCILVGQDWPGRGTIVRSRFAFNILFAKMVREKLNQQPITIDITESPL